MWERCCALQFYRFRYWKSIELKGSQRRIGMDTFVGAILRHGYRKLNLRLFGPTNTLQCRSLEHFKEHAFYIQGLQCLGFQHSLSHSARLSPGWQIAGQTRTSDSAKSPLELTLILNEVLWNKKSRVLKTQKHKSENVFQSIWHSL